MLDALDGRAVIIDGLGARVGHLLDEMDEWIGRAGEAERTVEAARRSLSSVAEAMTEHAYQELASALESPPRIAGKTAGFDQPPDVAAKVAEADRLRKLFDDAGDGQYNVLNLVESYQRNSMEADERLRAVRKLLEWNGCECECEHHWEDHDDDCDRCLACRIGEAIGK